jgi:hypothetical protein
MTNFSQLSTAELIIYKETLFLRAQEFLKEIEEIKQELIIRELPECRPLKDILQKGG